MRVLDSNKQKAVMELLAEAKGDISLVERALSECRKNGEGEYYVFTYEQVRDKIHELMVHRETAA